MARNNEAMNFTNSTASKFPACTKIYSSEQESDMF